MIYRTSLVILSRLLIVAFVLLGGALPAAAQSGWQVPSHSVPVGKGGGIGFGSASVGTAGRIFVDKGASADPAFVAMSQDCTIVSTGVITCTKTNNVSFGTAATVNTGTSGATIPLLSAVNTWSLLQTFSAGATVSYTSNSYWTSDSTPANVTRLNDRVMIGKNTNQYAGDYTDASATWLSNYTLASGQYTYLERNAQLLDYSTYGEMAALFAARTSDNESTPGGRTIHGCCTMPLAIVGVNDNAITNQAMWGLYETTIRLPSAGATLNEYDIANATSAAVSINPYTSAYTNATIGQVYNAGGEPAASRASITASISGTTMTVTAIASGTIVPSAGVQIFATGVTAQTQVMGQLTGSAGSTGTYTVSASQTVGSRSMQLGYTEFMSASSAAIVIGGNGSTFDHAIICGVNVISGSDPSCMDMSQGVMVKWAFDNTDTTGGYITSQVTSSANTNGLVFSNFGALFQDAGQTHILGRVENVASAVNYLSLVPAATAGSPSLTIHGTDTNVNLTLTPQGTGSVVTAANINAASINFGGSTLATYAHGGTFTPTMTFNGSATGITYTTQTGFYVKVGRHVHAYGRITLTNNGSGVGTAAIPNMPFASASSGPNQVGAPLNLVAGGSGASGISSVILNNSTTLDFLIPGAVLSTLATDTNLTNTADFEFSIDYQSAA
jgi:hypothetical protein